MRGGLLRENRAQGHVGNSLRRAASLFSFIARARLQTPCHRPSRAFNQGVTVSFVSRVARGTVDLDTTIRLPPLARIDDLAWTQGKTLDRLLEKMGDSPSGVNPPAIFASSHAREKKKAMEDSGPRFRRLICAKGACECRFNPEQALRPCPFHAGPAVLHRFETPTTRRTGP